MQPIPESYSEKDEHPVVTNHKAKASLDRVRIFIKKNQRLDTFRVFMKN